MEPQKDNQLTDKQNMASLRGNFHEFLSLKMEKLSSAIFMVTDYLSQLEPLKWKLRDFSLKILSDAHQLTGRDSFYYRVPDYTTLISSLKQMISLLSITLSESSVSVMNYSILKGEYSTILDQLLRRTEGLGLKEMVFVQPPTFNAPTHLASQREAGGQPLKYKGQTLKDIKDKSEKTETYSEKTNERRVKVINFIKDKGAVGIAEIAANFKDCGAKTIQRLLAQLIREGVIRREGNKRWSRYTLRD